MSAGLLEKLVLVLTVLCVLFVGGTVGLLRMVSLESGIPDVAVDSEFNTTDWLSRARAEASGQRAPQVSGPQYFEGASPSDARREAAREGGSGSGGGGAQEPPDDYFVSRDQQGSVDQSQTIQGFPWLKKVPGVAYTKPKPVPKLLYRKYRSFKDSYELAQSGGGKFTTTKSGDPAYEVTWLDKKSLLATRIGLQKNDKIVSINGQPVGNSPSAGKALYDQLKDETKFAVLVERGGEQVVLSYYVK